MYLLDTNHCILILEGFPEVVKKQSEIGAHNLCICDIIQGELLFGARNSKYKKDNLKVVNDFLADISKIYFTDELTVEIYAELKAKIYAYFAPKPLEKRKKVKLHELGFDENDLWIAAHALRNNLILVTADSDFNRMNEAPEISIPYECWKIKAPAISS
ncbi:type II toxin-antitoxin system VapC family toxin [Pantanalinema sp. GBBB05]|uniref:type II toxin-antitoxin system VapC family toxin n=1 Tax=Pantanalinema sp. GBBB05 TaxID=2604139 RepID=UPI001D676400|nr:type II toxin-antitoxin system VapC family toxin [Pantanalinema sp. GBBB05]